MISRVGLRHCPFSAARRFAARCSGLARPSPSGPREILLTAFDIQVLYRSDMHQVTIRASRTSDTPGTDGDTSRIAAGQDPVYHSAPGPTGVKRHSITGAARDVVPDGVLSAERSRRPAGCLAD